MSLKIFRYFLLGRCKYDTVKLALKGFPEECSLGINSKFRLFFYIGFVKYDFSSTRILINSNTSFDFF